MEICMYKAKGVVMLKKKEAKSKYLECKSSRKSISKSTLSCLPQNMLFFNS